MHYAGVGNISSRPRGVVGQGEAGAPEEDSLARSQAEVLLLILLSEIILLYVDHPGEGHLVCLILAREGKHLQ